MTKPIKAKAKIERKPLTQKRLQGLVHYDPITGVFTWLVRSNRRFIGARAGGPHARGYRQISIDNHLYLEHRLAWLYIHGRWPADQMDHINCKKSDNRLCNLREASNAENNSNRKLNKNNKSGCRGVVFSKHAKRWKAQITVGGQNKCLGYFDKLETACEAYWLSAKKHFGEFARKF